MTWLSGFGELWSGLLYLLAGNYEQAGVIGEIVSKADRVSTSLNVGANPERILQAPETSQQKQWLHGLQTLVKAAQEQKQINVRGKPFWLTKDSLWLVSKVAANNLRAHLLRLGLDNVPSSNNIFFDELQSHAIIQATPNHRAIWKIKIEDGDWSVDLTCVRIKPSLIWGNEEYPPPFVGNITVLGDGDGDSVLADTAEKTKNTKKKPELKQAVTISPRKEQEPASVPATIADDGVNELLNLFADSAPAQTTEAMSEPEESSDFIASEAVPKTTSLPTTGTKKIKSPKVPSRRLDELEKQGRKALADDFVVWLKNGISSQKLQINDTNAKIHIVESQVFIVTPGIFQRFCLEQTGQDDAWRKVQQGFEKLKVHKKRTDDLNI